MRRILFLLCCAAPFISMSAQVTKTEKGITFSVDEGLTPVTESRTIKYDGDIMAKSLIRHYDVKNRKTYVASSFKGDSLIFLGQDVLFKCIVKAYGEHRPLTLSPDAVWIHICQVFSHYVNDNAESLRPKIVSHDGKMSLVVVNTTNSLSNEDADWQGMIDDFCTQINKNIRNDIAETIAGGFSTTGPAERIAAEITLMDVMKPYFDYVEITLACGIPSITLTGTADDWKAVRSRTKSLKKYGMGAWVAELMPILDEFVKASEGRPDQRFWQSMVNKKHPEKLTAGGCLANRPTSLDGWFLKMFPYDKNGEAIKKVNYLSKMLQEMVIVPFRHIETDGLNKTETDMELWAGFVGAEEDPQTLALTPKIGWMVRVAEMSNDKERFPNNDGRINQYKKKK